MTDSGSELLSSLWPCLGVCVRKGGLDKGLNAAVGILKGDLAGFSGNSG